MIEFLKHAVGACGDGHAHPTLWWALGIGGTYLYIIKHKAIWCWKKGCQFCMKTVKKLK